MSWISLVCLLALSSSAFGYSAYGSFSGRMLVKPKLTLPVPSPIPQPAPIENYQATNTYGSSQGSVPSFPTFERPKAPTNPLTEFDIMCRGKTPETIIVLGEGERWVICLDDSKGVEQWCPKDLILNLESRECKPKYKKTKDYCAAQPCLNGGQCFLTEYSFECKCTPGYEGKHCELDARICQTQRPCGEGAICQSFHVRCELQHVCIFQDGLSYGLNSQQVHSNPCLVRSDIYPLAFSNRGYITCNGEEMFIHACPGGTIWDSVTKICVWPEMEGLFSKTVEPVVNKYGSSSYGSEQMIEKVTLPPQVPSYSTPALPVVPVEVPRPVELPKVPVQPVSSYGSQIQFPTERPVIQTQPQLVQQPQWMQRVQMPSTMPKMLPIQRSSGY